MIGTRLAHFQITAHLGTGGFGEVYQATDSKLGRSVAIKLLPEAFARDADRVARFDREARVLASLNHPNIAAIHGLEESGGWKFLVMELVPGETLAERIKRGPIPIDEALAIAKQIAEALEAAHDSEKCIIHRDLKPANVKITPDGKVKVLDFGLAKAYQADSVNGDFSNSPTLMSQGATNAGVILGTAAYMSPEQAKGRVVDRRTDIFAFGAVLYEMLTGRAAFEGETLGEMLGSVFKSEPDWNRLPAATPASIRKLLRRTLKKDPRQRLGDIRDARLEIDDAQSEPSALTAIPPVASGGTKFERAAWALVVLTLSVALMVALRKPAPVAEDLKVVRASVESPRGTSFNLTGGNVGSVAVSPEGTQMVFAASGSLWLRPLDGLDARPLQGTEGASFPFWSPDGKHIAFRSGGQLRRIAIATGVVDSITTYGIAGAGSWNQNNEILLRGTGNDGTFLINATGGNPTHVTPLNRSRGDRSLRYPQFLPDGRRYLFLARNSDPSKNGIYVGSIDSKDEKFIVASDNNAQYVSGMLLYLPKGSSALLAQAFDLEALALRGSPQQIVNQIGISGFPWDVFYAPFSASSGILAYHASSMIDSQLVWYDRAGKQSAPIGPAGIYENPEISPTSMQVAVDRFDPITARSHIWFIDLLRGNAFPMRTAAGSDLGPAWTHDGNTLLFTSDADGPIAFYTRNMKDGKLEKIMNSEVPAFWKNWSPSGEYALYTALSNGVHSYMLDVKARTSKPFLTGLNGGVANKAQAQISPDGKWVAYMSTESGRSEVYVQSFVSPGKQWLISTEGGGAPRWRGDGQELFFMQGNRLCSVVVRRADGDNFDVDLPKALFAVSPTGGDSTLYGYVYDVTKDGQRFLFTRATEDGASRPMTVVTNWQSLVHH